MKKDRYREEREKAQREHLKRCCYITMTHEAVGPMPTTQELKKQRRRARQAGGKHASKV